MSEMPDYNDLYNRHERREAARASRLPRCVECGEPIYQECAVHLKGAWYCDECLKDMRKVVPD